MGTSLTTALSSILIVTPYGWAVVIGVSLIAGLTASIKMNNFIKKTTEDIYDRTPLFKGGS